jgi:hypothetical protein
MLSSGEPASFQVFFGVMTRRKKRVIWGMVILIAVFLVAFSTYALDIGGGI